MQTRADHRQLRKAVRLGQEAPASSDVVQMRAQTEHALRIPAVQLRASAGNNRASRCPQPSGGWTGLAGVDSLPMSADSNTRPADVSANSREPSARPHSFRGPEAGDSISSSPDPPPKFVRPAQLDARIAERGERLATGFAGHRPKPCGLSRRLATVCAHVGGASVRIGGHGDLVNAASRSNHLRCGPGTPRLLPAGGAKLYRQDSQRHVALARIVPSDDPGPPGLISRLRKLSVIGSGLHDLTSRRAIRTC